MRREHGANSQHELAKELGSKPGLSRELPKGLSDTTRSRPQAEQVIDDNFMKYFAPVFPY